MTDCPFPIGALVDIYIRCSTGDQTLDSQLAAMRQWFADNHLVIGEIFADEARSGTSVAGRDNFLRMMAELDAEIQGLESDLKRGKVYVSDDALQVIAESLKDELMSAGDSARELVKVVVRKAVLTGSRLRLEYVPPLGVGLNSKGGLELVPLIGSELKPTGLDYQYYNTVSPLLVATLDIPARPTGHASPRYGVQATEIMN